MMENVEEQNSGRRNEIRRVALASTIGTSIEWFDFLIYGTAAALAFNVLFFPQFDSATGTLASLGTFAVAFVARPIGGAFFGHFGDRLGRKTMLMLTLMLMGIATISIGLLPTYRTIGIAAPILLVILRFVQGFAVGGEWGGAILMAVEHAPSNRRGLFGSLPQMGVPIGVIGALLVYLPIASLPEEQFLAWGWRIPFLVSFVLILTGLFIRLRITESPLFAEIAETNADTRPPIVEVFRSSAREVMLAAGAGFSISATFYVLITFGLSYGTETLGLKRATMLTIVLIASAVMFFAVPFFGALSDRLGRRPVFLAGAALMALMAFPLFWLLNTKSPGLITVGYILSILGVSMSYAVQGILYSEMFGTQVRYSGISLGYALSTVLAGGFTPLIAAALIAATGATTILSFYLLALSVISFACVAVTVYNYQSVGYAGDIERTQPERNLSPGDRVRPE